LADCQVSLTFGQPLPILFRMGPVQDTHLGNRLRVARAERDLSQTDLARLAGVTRQTISSIETGQYCPSALLAFRLSECLHMAVDELFYLKKGAD